MQIRLSTASFALMLIALVGTEKVNSDQSVDTANSPDAMASQETLLESPPWGTELPPENLADDPECLGPKPCLPRGSLCSRWDELSCCSGLICDSKVQGKCVSATADDPANPPNDDCRPEGHECAEDRECCSNQCNSSICA